MTIGNDVARDIHCDVTMSNDVAMCKYHVYHDITMHNDVAINLLSSVPNWVISLWVVWNKNRK